MRGQATQVAELTNLESEVAQLIVDAVGLDMPAHSIDPNMRLFGDGLALDSIDMLEIALAVTGKYGFQLRSDDPDNQRIFASLRALSEHIALRRQC
jgi:acyl carrier protein